MAKKKQYYKPKVSSKKHYFYFTLPNGKTTRVACKMRYATKEIVVPLTAEHVRDSIDAEGYGNTQTCVMAICVKAHAELFPHPVDGYVDWSYNRAYVVSKTDKNGWPSECIVYGHTDPIAKDFDKYKEDGVIDLWKKLRDEGATAITLSPVKNRNNQKQYHDSRGSDPDRKRSGKKRKQPKGAALRFGIVHLGLK